MKLYQAVCKGQRANFPGSVGTISSRRVFRTREEALAYEREFVAICAPRGDKIADLAALDPKYAVVFSVNELELDES